MSYAGVLRCAVTDAAVALRATHPASSYAFLFLSRNPVHTDPYFIALPWKHHTFKYAANYKRIEFLKMSAHENECMI